MLKNWRNKSYLIVNNLSFPNESLKFKQPNWIMHSTLRNSLKILDYYRFIKFGKFYNATIVHTRTSKKRMVIYMIYEPLYASSYCEKIWGARFKNVSPLMFDFKRILLEIHILIKPDIKGHNLLYTTYLQWYGSIYVY